MHPGFPLPLLIFTLPPRHERSSASASASASQQDTAMAANLAALMNASKAFPNKLACPADFQMWARDMEFILVRMGCWDVTTTDPPVLECTAEWTANNNGLVRRQDSTINSELHRRKFTPRGQPLPHLCQRTIILPD